MFVARFVGASGMNGLKGGGGGGGGGVFDGGAWPVPVPLEHYEGELHLGVRPEHVRLSAPDQGMATAEVRVVEPLGADTLIHLDAGGHRVVARVGGFSDFRPGDRVGVTLDRRHVHLFDAAGARPGGGAASGWGWRAGGAAAAEKRGRGGGRPAPPLATTPGPAPAGLT